MTQLITENFRENMKLGGPSHPVRQQEYQASAQRLVKEGSLSATILSKETAERNRSLMSEMRGNRRTSSVEIAPPKVRTPLGTWTQKGIPFERDSPSKRAEVRQWARLFYATHNLQPLCVDTYARFPVQGARLTSKDDQLTQFYEELFFNQLDYEELLVDFGREFWTAGEATTLASFSETLGVWEGEEFLNPDDVVVRDGVFGEREYGLRVPQYLREIVEKQHPLWEYKLLQEHYPEIIEAVTRSTNSFQSDDEESFEGLLSVDNSLISRAISKTSPWDLYGTPHMMRCFSQLMMEESLNAAQDAIADRLYSPFLLAKLGATASDMGDGGPWVPNQDELHNFSQDIQDALMADFRLLVHHFGVDVKSVFGRESMPRFDNDYNRLERQMLQVWGIGESMISGSSNGAYASSALNREYVTQHMSTYQKMLKKHFRRRALVVAEAQEHFDYRVSGGVRYPIYEEALKVDPESGEEYIVRRPKLLVPDLEFATINLHDENQERQFLQTLKGMGVPISDGSLIASVDIDLKDEMELVQQDKINKVVAEAEFKKKTIEVLKQRGLWEYADDELKAFEQLGQGIPFDESDVPPEDEGVIGDITDAPTTPNLTPIEDESTPSQANDEDVEEDSLLTRNQISQRPEISDEQRANMPRAAVTSRRPSVIDLREQLSETSIQNAVTNRDWAKSLTTQGNKRTRPSLGETR